MMEMAGRGAITWHRGRQAPARAPLAAALAGSVLVHAWLAAHLGGAPHRALPAPARPVISARIHADTAGPQAPAEPLTLPRDEGTKPFSGQTVRPAASASPSTAARSRPVPAQALRPPRHTEAATAERRPGVADATWYTVQDIDVYPRVAAPPVLPALGVPAAAEGAAQVLLWLGIDEHGAVVEVRAGEPGMPDAWLEAARARLSAMRFLPARKGERPVKVRLLMRWSLGAGKAEGAGATTRR
jgi:hypothetical protein